MWGALRPRRRRGLDELQGVGGLDDPDPSLAASFPHPGLLLLLLLQMWEGAMSVLWQVGKSSFTGFDNNVIVTELLGNILVVRHQHQLKVEHVEEIGQRCRRAQGRLEQQLEAAQRQISSLQAENDSLQVRSGLSIVTTAFGRTTCENS